MDLRGAAGGHYWTVAPWLAHQVARRRAPRGSAWSTIVLDPKIGGVRVSGRFRHAPQSDFLLVIVHGLGGDTESHYMGLAATAAERAGIAHLRLNLRGADRSGDDYYHAGLTADLRAAIESAEAARYASVGVLGYSLGGHLALRYAIEGVDDRVRCVAAVCPPLDLDRGAAAIDAPERWAYRSHILRALAEMHGAYDRRNGAAVSLAEARRFRTLREWDARIVAPRFGFASAEEYYAEVSAGPRLGQIAVPTLVVVAEADPMIPAETVRPSLDRARGAVDARWIRRGGHVGFPADVDLGARGPRGLESQVVGWMLGLRGGGS